MNKQYVQTVRHSVWRWNRVVGVGSVPAADPVGDNQVFEESVTRSLFIKGGQTGRKPQKRVDKVRRVVTGTGDRLAGGAGPCDSS